MKNVDLINIRKLINHVLVLEMKNYLNEFGLTFIHINILIFSSF